MKKKYDSPQCEVIILKMSQHLLESSPTIPNGGAHGSDPLCSPRRRGQVNWEDEEDDEDF